LEARQSCIPASTSNPYMHDYFDQVAGLRAKRYAQACLFAVCGILLSGCPKKQDAVKFAQVAEAAKDFDASVGYYEQAAKLHPNDSHLRLRLANARFEASNAHLRSGRISFDQLCLAKISSA